MDEYRNEIHEAAYLATLTELRTQLAEALKERDELRAEYQSLS